MNFFLKFTKIFIVGFTGVLLLAGFISSDSFAGPNNHSSATTAGECLALEIIRSVGVPLENPEIQDYLNFVGNCVARTTGPGQKYYFAVIKSENFFSFACPGGIILISSALLDFMKTESELACVLAREISHSQNKHAFSSINKSMLEKMSKKSDPEKTTIKKKRSKKKSKQNTDNTFVEIINQLKIVCLSTGFKNTMHLTADMEGMKLAFQTGYSPESMIDLLLRFRENKYLNTAQGSWITNTSFLDERVLLCKKNLKRYPAGLNMSKSNKRFTLMKQNIN